MFFLNMYSIRCSHTLNGAHFLNEMLGAINRVLDSTYSISRYNTMKRVSEFLIGIAVKLFQELDLLTDPKIVKFNAFGLFCVCWYYLWKPTKLEAWLN